MKKYLTLLLVLGLFACRKERIQPPPSNPGAAITVTVDQTQQGNKIYPAFEGLSFETQLLAKNPDYLNQNNTVLIQLLKTLGKGIIRIGGDSSDEIFWTGQMRRPSTGTDSLTTSDIDRLAAFSRASGWPVIFGLNMGANDTKTAAYEAAYVYNALGQNLYDLQNGNEPDIYHKYGLRSPTYDIYGYESDWQSQYAAVKQAVPNAPFAGPDAEGNTRWVINFAADYGKNVNLIDAHYYVDGPASDPSINYQTILQKDWGITGYLQTISTAASRSGLPFRITECNSIYGGGKAGTSDTFSATLWALDLMWNIAQNQGQGINFHGGDGLTYSPIVNTNGVYTARPVYYAMLAFKYGSADGSLIPATATNTNYNCTAYACSKTDNTYSVTLINREEKTDVSFKVQLSKKTSNIKIMRLSAPSVTEKSNISFAGSYVNADGTFTPAITEQKDINQDNFSVKVPAGSAAVVTIY